MYRAGRATVRRRGRGGCRIKPTPCSGALRFARPDPIRSSPFGGFLIPQTSERVFTMTPETTILFTATLTSVLYISFLFAAATCAALGLAALWLNFWVEWYPPLADAIRARSELRSAMYTMRLHEDVMHRTILLRHPPVKPWVLINGSRPTWRHWVMLSHALPLEQQEKYLIELNDQVKSAHRNYISQVAKLPPLFRGTMLRFTYL